MTDKIVFLACGCDICYWVMAPKDITLEQLLKQFDRLKPDWCDCGIRSAEKVGWPGFTPDVDVSIDYDDVKIISEHADVHIEM